MAQRWEGYKWKNIIIEFLCFTWSIILTKDWDKLRIYILISSKTITKPKVNPKSKYNEILKFIQLIQKKGGKRVEQPKNGWDK